MKIKKNDNAGGSGGSDMMVSEMESKSPYLVWEDVMVIAKNGANRILLNGITGYAVPDRIMVVMGPSGSGKSTFLDVLAGRLSPNVTMTGNVYLNGKLRSMSCRNTSYVTQEDILLGTLTVRETLTYSAHFRLPSTMSNDKINEVVDQTMLKMGLNDCADNKIGNWHIRGISGGEKRRLSISLELLTQPNVMFLDEPTTGLDSASAFFVVAALKMVALDGRIVICSIHQPSSHIYDLFDDLCLLSNGETIYFGEAKLAEKFFAEAGFPCPARRNLPDHFLRCINSDFDKMIAILVKTQALHEGFESNSQVNLTIEETKAILLKKYKESEYSVNVRERIREINLSSEDIVVRGSGNKSSTSDWKQLRTLTSRSLVNMARDMGYYWLRIMFCILVVTIGGIMYLDIGLANSAVVDRVKCYTYIYDFLLCLSIGGLPSILEEWKVCNQEKLNGHYGEAVFVISNFLSSFPFLLVLSISSGTILYYMVKFHMGFSCYAYLTLNFFFCFSIMETLAMIIASLVPNFLMGIGVSAGVIMLLTIASGLYRPLPELPNVFWRYPMSYISFTSWAIQGLYKNDMLGLEFEAFNPGEPKIKGEEILQELFGIDAHRSKWWEMAFLLVLFLFHKLVLFVLLKYKGKALNQFHRLYNARKTAKFNGGGGRSLIKLEHFGSSRRHQTLHPLSSQEGLSSPLA